MIQRSLQPIIEKWLFKNQIILIYGARQVGKTTLSKQILEKYSSSKKTAYFNCELSHIKTAFETTNDADLRALIGNNELIVLDEAQTIKNIGLVLKIIYDTIPNVQVIATGSSSFDLANEISEPLTGRALSFILYPFSIKEISDRGGFAEVSSKFENILTYGLYPRVFDKPKDEAGELLSSLASSYLYKDILSHENLRSSEQLLKILQLLALQTGSEVSYNEIGQKLSMSGMTVDKYIDLLEKCFVIFKLRAFSRNKRKEISKSVKIYFYDLGIRNALIQSFAPLDLRTDTGAIWENFCIVERKKINQVNNKRLNQYFYRTFSGEEVDYVEEYDGCLYGYEFKFNKERAKKPKIFLSSYQNASAETINKENWFNFLTSVSK